MVKSHEKKGKETPSVLRRDGRIDSQVDEILGVVMARTGHINPSKKSLARSEDEEVNKASLTLIHKCKDLKFIPVVTEVKWRRKRDDK